VVAWVLAHPGNNLGGHCPPWISLFGNSLKKTAHPGNCAKTVQYLAILVLHFVIWVGDDARLPTQNTQFRVGKLKSRGGKVLKKVALSRRSLSYPPSSENVPAPLGCALVLAHIFLIFVCEEVANQSVTLVCLNIFKWALPGTLNECLLKRLALKSSCLLFRQ